MTAALYDSLHPYQVVGVDFLAARERAFLADDMGLGKTLQAIRAADKIKAQRVLHVVPAVARVSVGREWQRWQGLRRAVHIVTDGKTEIPWNAEVVVVNYDLLKKRREDLFATGRYDVLILDEVQALKSSNSQRTKAVIGNKIDIGLVENADRVWVMTGTPVPNHYGELFVLAKHLVPDVASGLGIKNYWSWLGRFCVTRETDYGLQVIGNKNSTELAAALKPHMLRRRKAQVLADLPKLTIGEHVVEPDPDLLKQAKARNRDELAQMKALLNECIGGESLMEDALHLASIRRLIGTLKATGVAALARDILENTDEKVIVFSIHRDVMARIESELESWGVVTIHGGTTPANRTAALDSFTAPGSSVRVANLQIQACNSALNLQAASRVIFAEASWTPSDNDQAIARAHRMGQPRPVLATFVSLAGSIDEAVTGVLLRKMADIKKLFES